MSMARITPAQKPRGCASITCIAGAFSVRRRKRSIPLLSLAFLSLAFFSLIQSGWRDAVRGRNDPLLRAAGQVDRQTWLAAKYTFRSWHHSIPDRFLTKFDSV